MTDLSRIYMPIEKDLKLLEGVLRRVLAKTKNPTLLKISRFLLKSPGKRIRPALTILCAKSAGRSFGPEISRRVVEIAAGVELVHMASLVHDDVVDHSRFRHNRLSANAKWGEDVSIALGDYLYSVGFELISSCNNSEIISCISHATKAMCEGELLQICERGNFDLSKERYIIVVKKKTAALFAASCQAGAILSGCNRAVVHSLKNYGLNFGIAFQIVDDYMDVIGEKKVLGKMPGQDIAVGEMTLPLLNLLESAKENERRRFMALLKTKKKDCASQLAARLCASGALLRTNKAAALYVRAAKDKLRALPDSPYRKSLSEIPNFFLDRIVRL